MVFIPGFSQTAASWSGVLAQLPLRTPTTVVDIPSDHSFTETADQLAEHAGPGCWIGYSMGGRLALAVALRHPEVVSALVLVSATAGIEDADERAARQRDDDGRAAEVETVGTATFLNTWLAQPMFASVPADAPGLADRQTFSPAHLAHQLRALGTGVMPNYWDALPSLTMPVMIITGSKDAKFDAIGDAMSARVPEITRVRIECGHAVPLEAPAALAEALVRFAHPIRS